MRSGAVLTSPPYDLGCLSWLPGVLTGLQPNLRLVLVWFKSISGLVHVRVRSGAGIVQVWNPDLKQVCGLPEPDQDQTGTRLEAGMHKTLVWVMSASGMVRYGSGLFRSGTQTRTVPEPEMSYT